MGDIRGIKKTLQGNLFHNQGKKGRKRGEGIMVILQNIVCKIGGQGEDMITAKMPFIITR